MFSFIHWFTIDDITPQAVVFVNTSTKFVEKLFD
jgi:hypothetical protein